MMGDVAFGDVDGGGLTGTLRVRECDCENAEGGGMDIGTGRDLDEGSPGGVMVPDDVVERTRSEGAEVDKTEGWRRPDSGVFLLRDLAMTPSSGVRLSLEDVAAGARHDVDALGLGEGEPLAEGEGELLGVRRGDGRGNSWSSSSS